MEENGEYTPNDLEHPMSRDAALQRIRTSNTVMMSPELFEKLYLQPITNVKGDLRKTFGNPTPLGLMGFVISLTPIACCMMGWHGSGAYGAADMYDFQQILAINRVLTRMLVEYTISSPDHVCSLRACSNSSLETHSHF